MGGFLNIGGSARKTDRRTQLGGYGALENIFNFAIPAGKEAVGTSLDYWRNLLSGNRAKALQAVAPEVAGATAREDAARRARGAMGTERSGGRAGEEQKSKSGFMARIDNLLFGLRPAAAKEMGSAGAGLLSTGETAATNLTGIASQSRALSEDINMQTQRNVVNAIEGIMKAIL